MLDELSLLFTAHWWRKRVNEVKTSNESRKFIIILNLPLPCVAIKCYCIAISLRWDLQDMFIEKLYPVVVFFPLGCHFLNIFPLSSVKKFVTCYITRIYITFRQILKYDYIMHTKKPVIEFKKFTNVLHLSWVLAFSLILLTPPSTLRINTEIYHSLAWN